MANADMQNFQRHDQLRTDPKIHRNNRNKFKKQVKNSIRIEVNSREGAIT